MADGERRRSMHNVSGTGYRFQNVGTVEDEGVAKVWPDSPRTAPEIGQNSRLSLQITRKLQVRRTLPPNAAYLYRGSLDRCAARNSDLSMQSVGSPRPRRSHGTGATWRRRIVRPERQPRNARTRLKRNRMVSTGSSWRVDQHHAKRP